jgi:hypothetical protein
VRELTDLNGQWWDWQVARWDAAGFRLIADNALTYHHSLGVTFTDVAWASSADTFHHPVFRRPTAAEHTFARQIVSGEGHQVFVWDAETATGTVLMMIIAQAVQVPEGLVHH